MGGATAIDHVIPTLVCVGPRVVSSRAMSSSSEDSEAEWEELDASQREGKTSVVLSMCVICVPCSCCAGRSPSLSDPAHYQQQLRCSRECLH